MRDYELTILVPASLSEADLEKEQSKIAQLLKKSSVKVTREAKATKKPLAYEIGKIREGYYLYYELEMGPETVAELDKLIKMEENVMRHLIVKRA